MYYLITSLTGYVFSTYTNTLIPTSDAGYVAWLTAGNTPGTGATFATTINAVVGLGFSAAPLLAAYTIAAAIPAPVADLQACLQAALMALFTQNFNLQQFIINGTAATVTATQVGTFLATITNNFRSLRASIAAATTVSQLNAININAGWPSNP